MPFKTLGSTGSTKAALHELRERVGKAKFIVVAGPGVTGIEIAGELGTTYGKEKEIILVCFRCHQTSIVATANTLFQDHYRFGYSRERTSQRAMSIYQEAREPRCENMVTRTGR
jgi:hypothetical protein